MQKGWGVRGGQGGRGQGSRAAPGLRFEAGVCAEGQILRAAEPGKGAGGALDSEEQEGCFPRAAGRPGVVVPTTQKPEAGGSQ